MSNTSRRSAPKPPPPPQTPQSGGGRKRTIAVTLIALGAGAVTIGMISGSGSKSSLEPRTYRDVANCEAERTLPTEDCKQTFTQALSAHERSAPAYPSRENCEREFGSGNCVNPSANSGRASMFIPIMAGYLIGQRAAGGFQAAPLYRRPGDPQGEFRQSAAFPFATPPGSSGTSTSGGSSSFRSTTSGSSSTVRPPTGAPGMATTTTSRGGFGASGRGSSGT